MGKDFEVLSHTADIKIRVYGKTLKAFFRNAVIGMFQVIGPKIPGCKKENNRVICNNLPQRHKVEIESFDLDSVLVDFLSEALYLSDVHDQAYLDADIDEVTENKICAILHGIKVQGFEVVEIKAVTYHEMQVKKIDGIWQSNIVFDI
ncbi:archease [Candidatus Dependentiae bacterium]